MDKFILILLISFALGGCVHIFANPLNGMPEPQLNSLPTAQLCSMLTNKYYKFSDNGMREFNRRGLVDCKKGEVYCIGLGYLPVSQDYIQCRNKYDSMMTAYVQQQEYQNQQTLYQLQNLSRQQQMQSNTSTTVNIYPNSGPSCRGVWCVNPYGQTVTRQPIIGSL